VADEPAQLLVEAEGLDLEGVDRVLLRVTAQEDAAPQVIELGQVLDPERVHGAQQDESLDQRPVGLAGLSLACFQRGVDGLAQSRPDRLAAVQLPEDVGLHLAGGETHRHERPRELVERPVVEVLRARVLGDELLDLIVEEGADGLGQVLVTQDLLALRVDRLALLVDHVVELDDALAHVEVVAFDA